MPDESDSRIRNTAAWLFLAGVSVITTAAVGLIIYGAKHYPEFYAVAIRHFPTVVGLPFAAIASLFIVTACRIAVGDKINFKVFSLEFSGAGGPVVLWVLCFLAMALAITVTWDKSYNGPVGKRLFDSLEQSSSSKSETEAP